MPESLPRAGTLISSNRPDPIKREHTVRPRLASCDFHAHRHVPFHAASMIEPILSRDLLKRFW